VINDVVSDMLARIRNALNVDKDTVDLVYSKMSVGVLNVMKEEGYIDSFEIVDVREGIKNIVLNLKYYYGKPVIKKMVRISKPSRRVYYGISDLPLVYYGLGLSILSTSMGIISDREARKKKVGGELICTLF
jgi:small subunit ribosomal protein S8